MTASPHLLLTSLGAVRVREPGPRYTLSGREQQAPFAPLALWQLLSPECRPERMIVLATKKAANTNFAPFREEADRIGVPVEHCNVPDVGATSELEPFLAAVADRLPHGCRVTLDVTHGLRHHAFLFYSLALYLRSLRGVHIEGAWYGMAEGNAEASPIVDLQPALDLAEWFHAVRLFRDTGSASALARLLDPLHTELQEEARQSEDRAAYSAASRVHTFSKKLRETSFAYSSALPLELGRAAESLGRVVREGIPAEIRHRIPLADELGAQIGDAAATVAFPQRPRRKAWKEGIPLDEEERNRQLRLIEHFVERDQVMAALGAMRELIVSTVAHSLGGADHWLSRSARKRAELRLGALDVLVRRGSAAPLDEDQRWWGKLWNDLTQVRNAFMHQGMRPVDVEHPGNTIVELLQRCAEAGSRPAPTLGGGAGRLLISPQGQSPGVLFNALRAPALEIDRCVVVCSESSLGSLQPAAERAGFSGELIPLVMADPHTGAHEVRTLVRRAEDELLRADDVLANLTGGTTLMGVVVQALFEAAGDFDRSRRRFLLIDRRPADEQRSNPWVVSETYWLDSEVGDEDD